MYALTPTNVLLTSHSKLTVTIVDRNMLVAMRPQGLSPSTMLTVGRRALNVTSGTFSPFNEDKHVVRGLPEGRILVSGIKLDGQYIIIATPPKNI
jgi:hypothetical protein